ncbi:MAG: AmmeMemoRadiSam system radical SAM enzyme [bacterium]|nr:AmmeMemoRadiSam system radical SAM enzyme [bacterium]
MKNHASWRKESREANYWGPCESDPAKVECSLSPRHCKLKPGQMGFCGVRGNVDGKLHTFNYGKAVTATLEVMETEAVNHYSPGAKILSLGNLGCMLSCDFCQNWTTSQIKHLDPENVKFYSSEQIVEMALENDIKILSWTYNDPVVWQEFIVDTAKLGAKYGLKNLYKSALYIELDPLRELIEHMDIFSISLKSMDPEFYTKITKGRLEPVLDAIKLIAQSNRHLEVSQLVVTGRNDREEDALKTSQWMVDNVGPDVPLHFVGYHPAYRYDKPRTPLEVLVKAREIALETGVRYCYLGNVQKPEFCNTHCESCNNLLVDRFGLSVHVHGLGENGACTQCGTHSPIKEPHLEATSLNETSTLQDQMDIKNQLNHTWDEEIKSIHVFTPDESPISLFIERLPSNTLEQMNLSKGLSRIIVSRTSEEETGVNIHWNTDAQVQSLPVLDRAHFPV